MPGLPETRDIQDSVPGHVRCQLFCQHISEDVIPAKEQEGEDQEDCVRGELPSCDLRHLQDRGGHVRQG